MKKLLGILIIFIIIYNYKKVKTFFCPYLKQYLCSNQDETTIANPALSNVHIFKGRNQ